ncbi:hypothetical protein TIFTF001_015869 [Ficus carica]|uniref:Survival protein SurE-like phosphatase/nucleotidase domain-containing protein n=1 Tax=Ficus carica TaxID=3494 RepID=A0AA88A211_FICCA|nr:hypothetical protein TIFTF001_015869 [Ficus carica]
MENGGLSSGKRPTIMVTNDDGIDAPGLRALVHVLVSTDLYIVRVCAPDSEKSAVSHCSTYRHPISVKQVEIKGATAYAVSAGAREAFLDGVPSISLSYDWKANKSHVNDFTLSAEACLPIINAILMDLKNQTYPRGCFLNIDFPTNIAHHKLTGIRMFDDEDGTDKKSLREGYITITPLGALTRAEPDCHASVKYWLLQWS